MHCFVLKSDFEVLAQDRRCIAYPLFLDLTINTYIVIKINRKSCCEVQLTTPSQLNLYDTSRALILPACICT